MSLKKLFDNGYLRKAEPTARDINAMNLTTAMMAAKHPEFTIGSLECHQYADSR